MKFSDFVQADAIKAELAADEKETAITELVGSLVQAGAIKAEDRDSIVKAIMKREELGSTGIGDAASLCPTQSIPAWIS